MVLIHAIVTVVGGDDGCRENIPNEGDAMHYHWEVDRD